MKKRAPVIGYILRHRLFGNFYLYRQWIRGETTVESSNGFLRTVYEKPITLRNCDELRLDDVTWTFPVDSGATVIQ